MLAFAASAAMELQRNSYSPTLFVTFNMGAGWTQGICRAVVGGRNIPARLPEVSFGAHRVFGQRKDQFRLQGRNCIFSAHHGPMAQAFRVI